MPLRFSHEILILYSSEIGKKFNNKNNLPHCFQSSVKSIIQSLIIHREHNKVKIHCSVSNVISWHYFPAHIYKKDWIFNIEKLPFLSFFFLRISIAIFIFHGSRVDDYYRAYLLRTSFWMNNCEYLHPWTQNANNYSCPQKRNDKKINFNVNNG